VGAADLDGETPFTLVLDIDIDEGGFLVADLLDPEPERPAVAVLVTVGATETVLTLAIIVLVAVVVAAQRVLADQDAVADL
jgi:hypothetical protein